LALKIGFCGSVLIKLLGYSKLQTNTVQFEIVCLVTCLARYGPVATGIGGAIGATAGTVAAIAMGSLTGAAAIEK